MRTSRGFRDHQPLSHALAHLARLGSPDEIAVDVAARTIALPETSVRRVLRALENTPVSSAFTAALAAQVLELGIERVAAAAMEAQPKSLSQANTAEPDDSCSPSRARLAPPELELW